MPRARHHAPPRRYKRPKTEPDPKLSDEEAELCDFEPDLAVDLDREDALTFVRETGARL